MPKQITYSDHSRQAILRGVNQLADAVKVKVLCKLLWRGCTSSKSAVSIPGI